jgi:hypothetical protein
LASPSVSLPPALLGAVVSVFFLKTGIFMLFFLVPLGFVASGYNTKTGWAALLFAAAGNSLFSLILAAFRAIPTGETAWDIFYFIITAAAFLWIIAPPRGDNRFLRIPGIVRLAAGSAACALFISAIFFHSLDNELFYGYIKNRLETIGSLYRPQGADVVQNAFLESMTPEFILSVIKLMLVRGGALASCVLFFFLSRQISLVLARVFRRHEKAAGLRSFHVPASLIWVLSLSLLLVLISRGALEPAEILGWNVLTLCAILYFAQGLGIIQYFLTGPAVPPFLRILLSVILVILLFSFGINAVFLGLIILLGIVENWVSFRTPESNGPPSTPGA